MLYEVITIAEVMKKHPDVLFLVDAVSGLGLLAAGATTMLASPVFYVKLGFIAVGVVVMHALRSRVFDAVVLLGLVYWNMGRLDDAIDAYRRAS